jgi:hypothetical protein
MARRNLNPKSLEHRQDLKASVPRFLWHSSQPIRQHQRCSTSDKQARANAATAASTLSMIQPLRAYDCVKSGRDSNNDWSKSVSGSAVSLRIFHKISNGKHNLTIGNLPQISDNGEPAVVGGPIDNFASLTTSMH